MTQSIDSSAIQTRIQRQHTFLGIEFEDLYPALDHMRARFMEVVGDRTLSSQQDLRRLCDDLDVVMGDWFPRRRKKEQVSLSIGGQEVPIAIAMRLRGRINAARQKIAESLQRQAGWRREWMNRLRASASARKGADIGPDPDAHTDQEILAEITDAEKRAYRSLIEDWHLPVGLVYQLLADLHPGRFRRPDEEGLTELSECIGKSAEQRPPLSYKEVPPQILTHPDLAWFRHILFNAKRDHLLPQFAEQGAEAVWATLNEDIAQLDAAEAQRLQAAGTDEAATLEIRQEFALKRRMTNALAAYFVEAECQDDVPCLRKTIRGRSYPDRQQKVAAYDLLNFGGRMYNAGKVGSGKTGAIIYTLMLAMQQGKIAKTTIMCPACILGEWRMALSDDAQYGYFNEGMTPDGIVFIDGTPGQRPLQWEAAKDASVVVMGTELARGSTNGVQHKELLKNLGSDFFVLDEAHRTKNTAKKAEISEATNSASNGNGDEDCDQQEVMDQRTTDMSIMYEVGTSSPYRSLSSATFMTNKAMDLVAATLMMNAEPETYGCIATPPQHRFVAFDMFLERNRLERDADVLQTLPRDQATRRLCMHWDDIKAFRKDVGEGGRECPRRFLPFLYRPPKEACVPVPEFPPPIVEIVPITPVEQAICDAVREDEQHSAFRKIGMLIRATCHPYGVNNRPETGASLLRRTKEWIDLFFAEGARHIVVASPIYAQGMTKDMPGQTHQSVYCRLQDAYADYGVTVTALDGGESGHRVLDMPSPVSGRYLTKTQRLIEDFAQTERGIQVVQKDTVGIGINEYARAGVSHVIILGYGWTDAEIEQFLGRFARPGQSNDVRFVILLPQGISVAMHSQAGRKTRRNEVYLSGGIPTQEDRMLFHEKPSNQPISIYTKSEREQFVELCNLMAGRGRQFINGDDELIERFVELYNRNWESSFNGNVLRAVGAIMQRRAERMRAERRAKRGMQTEGDDVLTVADDGGGTFGFHRTMMGASGFVIHTSDLNPKMIAESLGQSVLGDRYCPDRVHTCGVDETPYDDHSIDIRVTSLVLDCLKHAERPRRWGREMIRTFLEGNRILTKESEQDVPGEWCITLTVNMLKDQRRLQLFLNAFPFFGLEVIPEATGRVVCEQLEEGDDPFEVLIFTVRRVGDPQITEDMPWEELPTPVRQGLNLLARDRKKRSGSQKKKPKTPKKKKDENGSYHDRFVIQPLTDGGQQTTVEYTAAPDRKERREALRLKRQIIARCTDPVRAVLRQHASISQIADTVWLQMSIDDVLVAGESLAETPPQVRDAYAGAIVRDIVARSLDPVTRTAECNAGQTKGCFTYVEDSGGRYLLLGNAQGNTSGGKYYIEKRNGKAN